MIRPAVPYLAEVIDVARLGANSGWMSARMTGRVNIGVGDLVEIAKVIGADPCHLLATALRRQAVLRRG